MKTWKDISKKLIEELASYEHDSWANWMEYLFEQSNLNEWGDVIIPSPLADRWRLQARTLYMALSEQEKESDRIEVRKILPVICSTMDEYVKELVPKKKVPPEGLNEPLHWKSRTQGYNEAIDQLLKQHEERMKE